MSTVPNEQGSTSSPRPARWWGNAVIEWLVILFVVFILLLYAGFILARSSGFFIWYNFILGKLDSRFANVGMDTIIREGLISLGILTLLGILSFWFRFLNRFGYRLLALSCAGAIPLVPLVLTKSVTAHDLYPLAMIVIVSGLLIVMAWPKRLWKVSRWLESTIVDGLVYAVSVGMIYYFLIWNSPVSALLTTFPYSVQITLTFSVIASVLALLSGHVYIYIIRPHIPPLKHIRGFEDLANLPLFLILLGLVPTVYSLYEHNFSSAVTMAGISALAATVAKLLLTGFVAGIGQTIWNNFRRRVFGEPPREPPARRTELTVEADATIKSLPAGEPSTDIN